MTYSLSETTAMPMGNRQRLSRRTNGWLPMGTSSSPSVTSGNDVQPGEIEVPAQGAVGYGLPLLCGRRGRHQAQLFEELQAVEMKMGRYDHASLQLVVVGEREVDVSTRRRDLPGRSVEHAQMRPRHGAADRDNRTFLDLAGNGEFQVGKCLPKYRDEGGDPITSSKQASGNILLGLGAEVPRHLLCVLGIECLELPAHHIRWLSHLQLLSFLGFHSAGSVARSVGGPGDAPSCIRPDRVNVCDAR